MALTNKNIREKEFHNRLQSSSKGRFENIFYKSTYNLYEDYFKYLKSNALNAEILDYGCGVGSTLKKVLNFNPKRIIGIDISEISIRKAKDSIQNFNSKAELSVDNCEKTKFKDNTFNLVYGDAILHHLNISLCLNEIRRILKPGGKLLFTEPLGTNPLINLYRKLTPNSRSKDERPLDNYDFKLIKEKFNKVEIKYYGFLTLLFFPLYSSPQNSIIFNFLKNLDQYLMKNKFFQKLAWSVLIIAEN